MAKSPKSPPFPGIPPSGPSPSGLLAPEGDPDTAANRLTMADVAERAGVSVITVSRALRDSPSVREETRRRIQDLARDMGYRFNVSARNLRLQRSQTIAVVVEMMPSAERPMSDPFPLDLLGGICQELTTAGYNVLLTTQRREPASAIQAADGAILLGQGPDDDAIEALGTVEVPVVVWGVDQRPPHAGPGRHGAAQVVFVGSDNRQGGRLAATRLLETGRRRLVFLGDTRHPENAERLAGFTQALAEHGTGSRAAGSRIVAHLPTDFTFAAGVAAIESLAGESLAGGPDFDGVFACNDLIALGALRALSQQGRHVPDTVSVIGYDDTPLAACHTPALTSIHQDWTEGGRRLAASVLDLINGRYPGSTVLPTRLVVRST